MVKDLGSSEVPFEDTGMGDLFRCDRHADIFSNAWSRDVIVKDLPYFADVR